VAIAAPYPSTQSVDVALRDGSSIHLRPVQTDDRAAIRAFLEGVSAESLALRFFCTPNVEWVSDWSVDVDYAERYAIVATAGTEHEIVAHGAYVATSEGRAEVAFLVADAARGHGIASLMLAHLAVVAEQHGVSTFFAEVLPTNHRMLGVFRDSGFPVATRFESGVAVVELAIAECDESVKAFDSRQHDASASAVAAFLAPHTVAIIGSSQAHGIHAAQLTRNLVGSGFAGTVYAVGGHHETIAGVPVYASVGALPEAIDLAVAVVPAGELVAVARTCANAGVRALLAIGTDSDTLAAKRARAREVQAVCRDSGMRLLGPNSLGVVNAHSAMALNATVAGCMPLAGRTAVLSQSGAVGTAVLEAAGRLGLGISGFVSFGDKADVSGNDLLEYWESDPDTDVIVAYLESFGNPRRFARIARRVSAKKPIVVLKSGRAHAGTAATTSRTGKLLSSSDVTIGALLKQAGVIRTDTVRELIDTAALLSSQPAPRGRRVAIIANGHGPGVVCADDSAAAGLEVAALDSDVQAQLTAILPPGATVANPIDLTAGASAFDFRKAIEIVVSAYACDAVITVFTPPLTTAAVDVAREIDTAAQGSSGVPVASVFMERELPARGGPISAPRFAFPDDAVSALSRAAEYFEWRNKPAGTRRQLDCCRPERASSIIDHAVASGTEWLSPKDTVAVLLSYGLSVIGSTIVNSPNEAMAAAARFGTAVALKAVAPGLRGKCVRVGLRGDDEVLRAAWEIRTAVTLAGAELEGLLVQPVAEPGLELVVGAVHNEEVGPVIACAASGRSAELFEDVAVRITPLTDADADELVRSLRIYPLLAGYDRRPPRATGAVEGALLRVGALVEAQPEIAEIDLNPLIVNAGGAVIVDARIRVHNPSERRPPGALPQLS
jgi:acyl-CoA synthetase (NDP forming)/GNAT superfamily N-acetyltransferase